MNERRQEPGPGQESVWDYPRPPRVEETSRHIQIIFQEVVVAETRRAVRVLETSHPPVYYIPRADVLIEHLTPERQMTFCEWKGRASYYGLVVGHGRSPQAAWCYHDPSAAFALIKDHFAFYPSRVDACFVDGERVRAQAGDFYGGWITSEIVGPFKGEPGTRGW